MKAMNGPENDPDRRRRWTADEIRDWQSRPPWERFNAIAELSTAEYLRQHPEALDEPPTSGWDKATLRILPFPEALDDPKQ